VARAAQVSRATVSYVLNGVEGQRISAATRERVRRIAEELHYQPSAASIALRSGSSEIALVGMPYWPLGQVVADALASVVAKLEAFGYTAVVHFDHGEDAEHLARACTRIQPVALIAGARHLTPEFVRKLRASGTTAIVAIGGRPLEHVTTLVLAQEEVGRTAVRHLVERGHRRILAVVPAVSDGPHFWDARLEGARAQAAAQNATLTVLPLAEPRSATGLATLEAALTKKRARPTAIYAYNDELALEVLEFLLDRGFQVPDDVALLGCDDSPLAAAVRPRLSSVRLWPPSTWQLAADAIDALAQERRVEAVLHAEPLVVTQRETT
jgi:DNA-binding LacI/PurR family transcriptional regulator